jgi:hypothetical protein
MSNEFDASFASNDPISTEIIAQQRKDVESWSTMSSALANAKLHAQNELQRLVSACNRLAWGAIPAVMGVPTGGETALLLERLGAEDRERLIRESRLAAEQRHLIAQIDEAERQQLERQKAEQDELAKREAEQRELAEFEAYDAAEKHKRFEAWRASQRN